MINAVQDIEEIPGTVFAKPKWVGLAAAISLFSLYFGYGVFLIQTQVLGHPTDIPLGGDFSAFWGASRAIFAQMQASIYAPDIFESWLMEIVPGFDRFGLTWQYPPTFMLLIWPLALMPQGLAYVVWIGLTGGLFVFSIHKIFGLSRFSLFLLVAAPVVYTVVITGQNSFLTAALLFTAATQSERRPILAGVAAGLLTIKPQLGVLLPFAFMAAGHWRAFSAAAVTTLLMVLFSLLLWGLEPWQAFVDALFGVGEGVSNAVYPLQKMPTIFSVLKSLGLPSAFAMFGQAVAAVSAIAAVSVYWKRCEQWDLRAAVLVSCVFFCTPYAYVYEMILLILPVIVVLRQAKQHGWRKMEEICLSIAIFGSLFLLSTWSATGPYLGFGCVAIIAAITFRRALKPIITHESS